MNIMTLLTIYVLLTIVIKLTLAYCGGRLIGIGYRDSNYAKFGMGMIIVLVALLFIHL